MLAATATPATDAAAPELTDAATVERRLEQGQAVTDGLPEGQRHGQVARDVVVAEREVDRDHLALVLDQGGALGHRRAQQRPLLRQRVRDADGVTPRVVGGDAQVVVVIADREAAQEVDRAATATAATTTAATSALVLAAVCGDTASLRVMGSARVARTSSPKALA